MLNCFKDCSTENQIHSGAIQHVAYPILSVPFLLMPWRLKEFGARSSAATVIIILGPVLLWHQQINGEPINDLVQDHSNYNLSAMELLQSCTKP